MLTTSVKLNLLGFTGVILVLETSHFNHIYLNSINRKLSFKLIMEMYPPYVHIHSLIPVLSSFSLEIDKHPNCTS